MKKAGSYHSPTRYTSNIFQGLRILKPFSFDLQLETSPFNQNAQQNTIHKKELPFRSYYQIRETNMRGRQLRSRAEINGNVEQNSSVGVQSTQKKQKSKGKNQLNGLKMLLISGSNAARRTQEAQNIHFSELVVTQQSSFLLSGTRNRKRSTFLNSVKAKNLMSRSLNNSKTQKSQNFKSIQVNNQGKYVLSRKIVPQFQLGACRTEAKTQQSNRKERIERALRTSTNVRRQKNKKQQDVQNGQQYLPWQIQKSQQDQCLIKQV